MLVLLTSLNIKIKFSFWDDYNMITKEQALENVKKYLNERKRDYIFIVNQDKVVHEMQKKIPYGKYEDKIKDIYVVNYDY